MALSKAAKDALAKKKASFGKSTYSGSPFKRKGTDKQEAPKK